MDFHPSLDRLMTEINANIEMNAEQAVQLIQMGKPKVTYPPNGGLKKAEAKALSEIDLEDAAAAMALKKIIADAIYSTVYRLMTDLDGLSDPEITDGEWSMVKLVYGNERKPMNEHPILNIALGEGYWKWVRVRKLKSPRLDNLTDLPA